MDSKMKMVGVKSGGSVEQRSDTPADQSMRQIDAAHDVRQLIQVSQTEMDVLRGELATLRAAVLEYDAKAQKELGQLEAAEAAAKDGNADQVLASLKGMGRWVGDLAAKVGATVLAKVIEKQMGLS